MKFSKLVGLGILSVSLATVPMISSVSAQDATAPGNTTTTTTTEADRDFDWGWLGLLGLAGLAGLAGKKRDDDAARYQDPTVSSTTTSSRSDYR